MKIELRKCQSPAPAAVKTIYRALEYSDNPPSPQRTSYSNFSKATKIYKKNRKQNYIASSELSRTTPKPCSSPAYTDPVLWIMNRKTEILLTRKQESDKYISRTEAMSRINTSPYSSMVRRDNNNNTSSDANLNTQSNTHGDINTQANMLNRSKFDLIFSHQQGKKINVLNLSCKPSQDPLAAKETNFSYNCGSGSVQRLITKQYGFLRKRKRLIYKDKLGLNSTMTCKKVLAAASCSPAKHQNCSFTVKKDCSYY